MKTNVRLFKLSDVIFMLQTPEERDMEVVAFHADLKGFSMKIKTGVDNEGDSTFKLWSSDWISVAINLGVDKAELVKNPDGNLYVLLCDKAVCTIHDLSSVKNLTKVYKND